RIIDAVKQMPNADNTIFVYIAGDNGASAEGGLEGCLNENLYFNGLHERWQDNLEHVDELGGPRLAGKRNKYVYYPGQVALPDGACPPVLNKSFSITADVELPDAGAEGMVITQGGLTGGYGLYLRGGKAHFVYNLLALERFTISSGPLPKGKVALAVEFAYHGQPGEFGRPATVTLTANGQKVGEGKLPRTVPNKFAIGEGIDVGMDLGSAVDFTDKLPFAFTGKIEKVTVELK